MAALRLLSRGSGAISFLCPCVAQRIGRRLDRKCVWPTRSWGSLEKLGSARAFLGANVKMRTREGRFLGEKGRRSVATNTSKFTVRAGEWKSDHTPYETLEIERDAEDDEIKASYRRMAKQYHPDVYKDNTGGLEDGETPESRFIRVQAAYDLLMDKDQRREYDNDHRINPMKASKAWMDWVLKKKKAFEQRGDMAASVWAENQQREMSLKARRLAKHKMDPEEERRILAKEKMAAIKNFETTLTRHTLVLKKRELVRRKNSEEAKKLLVQQLLAAEGLELDDEQ